MKIAYLISAYKDPSHLRRLISALSHGVEDTVSFFIHIDAKVDIRPFIDKCNGKEFFCRKVETGKSDKLMDLLDKHNGYYYRE